MLASLAKMGVILPPPPLLILLGVKGKLEQQYRTYPAEDNECDSHLPPPALAQWQVSQLS
jgi:hypothetical protein